MNYNKLNCNKLNRLAPMAAVCAAIAVSPAEAANSLYAAGDLVMFFQQDGGSNTVYANLGPATTYRGSAAGNDVTPMLNILNVSGVMETAFGVNWASDPSIYAGIAGVNNDLPVSSFAFNGDLGSTIYISSSRLALGDPSTQGSVAKALSTDTAAALGAGDIISMNTPFANGPNQQIGMFSASTSQIDDKNPIGLLGVQGTAFRAFSGGVQQQGSASTLGSLDGLGEIEFALDLYRISRYGTSTDPNFIAGPERMGTFEGTFVLGQNGSISFIPEPSSMTLLGLTLGSLVFRRRR